MDVDSKILIAAISAGSAILGAVVTQIVSIFLAHLERRHRKKVLLREKYEELAHLVQESNYWLSEQMKASSLSNLGSCYPEKARRAMVLAHIYFPKLRKVCEKYVDACVDLTKVLVDNYQFLPDCDAGTQVASSNMEALKIATDNVHVSRQNLEEQLVKFADTYAAA